MKAASAAGSAMLALAFCVLRAHAETAWEPDSASQLEVRVAELIEQFEARLPDRYFSEAFGYVVLPAVKRIGFGLGGAWGRGLAFANGRLAGHARFWQITSGIQLGGRSLAMIVLFRGEEAWQAFTSGQVEFMGQAGVALLGVGHSATPAYNSGTAIFTMPGFGLMAEATISTGRLSFRMPGN